MTPGNLRDLVRLLGPEWLAYRAWHMLERKTGALARRSPVVPWETLRLTDFTSSAALVDHAELADELRSNERFLFSTRDRARYGPLLERLDAGDDWCEQRLEEIAAGRLRLFAGEPRDCGWPPRWQRNAITGEVAEDMRHFSRLSEFDFGDVKTIWEPNRFAFCFDLVRIYWRTGDERCPALFWEAVEDWRSHNPPNAGINWKCGQEASFRAFAWCFGLWGFMDAGATTPKRVADLVVMLAVTGRRIEANLGYALSQKNNHGVSEAAGLLTLGLLLPMLDDSDRWERTGRRLLERQARELVYGDGGFSQYSANYHRVMLDDFLWAVRIGEAAGRPLSDELRNRMVEAGRFLMNLVSHSSGGVPRYGHDDGALVLPLSRCPYDDFRPALQAVAALDRATPLPFATGPWSEKTLWLFGAESLEREVVRRRTEDAWKESGYGLLRRGDSFAFVRGGRFRHRPSQADLLHVDLWWRGRNVAIDPGTYSYNGTGHWGDVPFADTSVHNTVAVDGLDQAERVRRFLFLPWPAAPRRRQLRSAGGEIGLLELEHDGYRRLPDPVAHRRAIVQLGRQHWLVADQLTAVERHEYRIQWLFSDTDAAFDEEKGHLRLSYDDVPYHVLVLADGDLEMTLVRADAGSARGWHAPRYQQLAPALSLAALAHARRFRFYSILGPGDWRAARTEDDRALEVEGRDWRAKVALTPSAAAGPISSVRWIGAVSDELDLS